MRAAVVIGLALLALVACTTTPKTDLPDGYVTVPAYGNAVRSAVAPTGNRIIIRKHDNPPEGTLEFWRDAVQAELTDGKGYELLESAAVAGKGGRAGWEFLFEVSRTEGAYLYLVLIRVEKSDVYVTEAGGRESFVRKDLGALRASLR